MAKPSSVKGLLPRRPAPNYNWRSTYTCPELGRTCDREGAYDAFDLPSLYNGTLKPYRFSDSK